MASTKSTDTMAPELKLPHPFEPVSIETHEDSADNYAKFVVKPLERGFGITVGNALRRVLLSALPGASVVAVQIEGAPHEFTALPGISPDVTGIILNLKDLVLKIDDNSTDLKRIEVDVKGPAVLKAGDLKLPSLCTVCNPELEIASVNDGAHLETRSSATSTPSASSPPIRITRRSRKSPSTSIRPASCTIRISIA